jgi:hypothetical protein
MQQSHVLTNVPATQRRWSEFPRKGVAMQLQERDLCHHERPETVLIADSCTEKQNCFLEKFSHMF